MTKWATEIDDAARVPEIVSRAFHTATGGRPGPVVIGLPADMLKERVAVADAPVFAPVEAAPGKAEIARLRDLLVEAKRADRDPRRQPMERGSTRRRASLRRAVPPARGDELPARCRCSIRCIRSYAGDLGIGPNPKLIARIKKADLVMLCGGRLGEIPSQGYTLFDVPDLRRPGWSTSIRAPRRSAASIIHTSPSSPVRSVSPKPSMSWSRRPISRGARRRMPRTPSI